MVKFNVSYVKLQDAFVAEVGVNIGSWKAIGYNMVKSSNFKYYDGDAEGLQEYSSVSLSDGLSPAWKAENIATLNDCAASSVWQLDVLANKSTGGSVQYAGKITDGAGGDCEILTPNFKAIDTENGQVEDIN